MAVVVTKTNAFEKSRANNKASTDSFSICHARCTYKAHTRIKFLITRLSSPGLFPPECEPSLYRSQLLPWLPSSSGSSMPVEDAISLPTSTKFSNPKACREILACTGYASGDRNTINAVESRAYPNQRLVRAFDIDNAFTTKSDESRKDFTHEAKAKLSALKEADWKHTAGHAEALLQYGLETKQCCLDPLVRSLSLKITLHTLFKLDPMDMDDKFIGDIISCINDLWVESKTSVEPSATTKKKLRQALARSFPNADFSAKGNPLDSILPADETLWRVVLSGFIEVAFRKGALSDWKLELVRFVEDPTDDKLKSASCDTSVPVDSSSKKHSASAPPQRASIASSRWRARERQTP